MADRFAVDWQYSAFAGICAASVAWAWGANTGPLQLLMPISTKLIEQNRILTSIGYAAAAILAARLASRMVRRKFKRMDFLIVSILTPLVFSALLAALASVRGSIDYLMSPPPQCFGDCGIRSVIFGALVFSMFSLFYSVPTSVVGTVLFVLLRSPFALVHDRIKGKRSIR